MSVCMKEYENKLLSHPGEDLNIWDKSQLSRGKCDNGGQIAEYVQHQNGNRRVSGSSFGTAVYFSNPVPGLEFTITDLK